VNRTTIDCHVVEIDRNQCPHAPQRFPSCMTLSSI
jgi:hypothetical protein